MVHVRLNEREPNPNPHINFITTLPTPGHSADQEDARQLLRALAAQVRPVMKAHGFAINSFEEYEYNRVFLGRNWNAGETVELVLRGASDAFYPVSWLLNTLCHELAHIKHMNHGPAFQALWAQLRREVRELQNKGYYGDGYWSSGTRLVDSARMSSDTLDAGEFPEYMCGGAQARARPTARRRRRRTARPAGPSNHTGAQTAKKRKAGGRVTAKDAFVGEGRALAGEKDGFGRSTKSKRAREERAAAAERRLLALQGQASFSNSIKAEDEDDEGSEEETDEPVPEADSDCRRAMDGMQEDELDLLRVKLEFHDDFIFPPRAGSSGGIDPNLAPELEDDIVNLSSGAATTGSNRKPSGSSKSNGSSLSFGKGKARMLGSAAPSSEKQREMPVGEAAQESCQIPKAKESSKVSYGALVKDEVHTRRKEALGLTARGQMLGSEPSQRIGAATSNRVPDSKGALKEWPCLVCTLLNEPAHLACSACGTVRGETDWSGNSI